MIATVQRRGRATTHVTVVGHLGDDESIADVAMAAARETKSSLFGWSITRHNDVSASVALHTD